MAPRRARQARALARLAGAILMWLAITAAFQTTIEIEGWMVTAASVIGTGLVLWGSIKTKVEKLEDAHRDNRVEIEKRLSRDVFVEFQSGVVDRLERIEGKLDNQQRQ